MSSLTIVIEGFTKSDKHQGHHGPQEYFQVCMEYFQCICYLGSFVTFPKYYRPKTITQFQWRATSIGAICNRDFQSATVRTDAYCTFQSETGSGHHTSHCLVRSRRGHRTWHCRGKAVWNRNQIVILGYVRRDTYCHSCLQTLTPVSWQTGIQLRTNRLLTVRCFDT